MNIRLAGAGLWQRCWRASRRTKIYWLALSAVSLAFCCFIAGCFFNWSCDTTAYGVPFERVRMADNGLAIGMLKEDTVIAGRPCKRGWVHLLPTGVPQSFTASREMDGGRFKIPAGTWVTQNAEGVVVLCAFPSDTEVQGCLCRGSGGPEGTQTAFYPSGALKQFFLRHDTQVQGIPCKAGLFSQTIHLHENGQLASCVLSAALVRDGYTYDQGTEVHFDAGGRLVFPETNK